MESPKPILLGYNAFPYFSFKPLPNATDDERLKFFSSTSNLNGRLLLALIQYLQQFTNYFEKINFVMTYEKDRFLPNGMSEGLVKKINNSEIDVGVVPAYMYKRSTDAVDFSYPYKLEDFTFVTRKPEYKPHIFGIFQMFSVSVWLTILSVLIAMPIVSYTILKKKYNFNIISFHVFAVLMRQSSLITPSSLVEKLLVYSWVVGAMLLCLCYDSVFLSFLSIPPLTKIKHLSDLALAVDRGDYNCIAHLHTGVVAIWKNSEHEHLRLIAKNIAKNKLSYGQPLFNFVYESQKQNLAYLVETRTLGLMDAEKFFYSEDRFQESMIAMMVRRGFCCKDLLDSFVHKMMASGLYFKYLRDASFQASKFLSLLDTKDETTNRILTLTDVAPAFIFLLSGYFISFLVLIFEIVSNCKKRNYVTRNPARKRRKLSKETPV